MWLIYIMEYYLSTKRNKDLIIHVTAWVSLRNSKLNEKSQSQKATSCMIPFIGNVKKDVGLSINSFPTIQAIHSLYLSFMPCLTPIFKLTALNTLFPRTKMYEHLITWLSPTLCNPVDCSLPGSSVHGIFQARIPEWVAISSSRGY